MNPYYPSAISDAERAEATELAERALRRPLTREEVEQLACHLGDLQNENNDLNVLHAMTVEHAMGVENELMRRNTEIGKFLAATSHELRTPLTAILGYTELLLEAGQGAPDHSDLLRIHAATKHIVGLVDSVLDLARVEGGHLEIGLDDVSIRPVLEQVLDTLSPARRSNKLICPLVEGVVRTDRRRLFQILLNLVGNGLKYTDNGTIRLDVELHEGRYWAFKVTDDGPGIPRRDQRLLFHPYRRGETQVEGIGLGLALSRRLARLLGGDIEVESTVDVGSVFTLKLPLDGRALPIPPQTQSGA